jgi:hypothetical protein
MPVYRVDNATVEDYRTDLREEYRPPSRGGNTSALHAHYLTIAGVGYSFLALGSCRWVYKGDTVSFEYELKGQYRNIKRDTIRTLDSKGCEVVRGNRGFKPKLRTAPARLPGSKRGAKS